MYKLWINLILLLFIDIISEVRCLQSSQVGHFRCTWHTGPAPPKADHHSTTPTYKHDQSACSKEDSSRLTSYINHCTKQNYVPLLACTEDRTWNCQSFIAMCKTLIHTETVSAMGHVPSSAPSPHEPVIGLTQTGDQKESVPMVESDASQKMFNPDENYFTMKEMAVAVLVSFMTGATMLAVVICVVWKCRHSHLNSEQVREAAHQSAKRLAAIHAITHIAHAIGGGQDTPSTGTISNPQYGQIIASQGILDGALSEHDRIYEEIITGRKSSCNNSDCIYTNVNKVRKKSSVIRPKSLTGDLRRIDESAEESDVGYEADSSPTPQNPRKQINSWGNVTQNASASPAMNAHRLNNNGVNGDMLRKPLSFRNNVHNNSNPVEADIGNVIYKDEISKCDSGYNDELSESLMETITIYDDVMPNDEGIDDPDKPRSVVNGERKQSLRL